MKIALLNRDESRAILEVTANRLKYSDKRDYVTLPNWVAYQGESDAPVKKGTGRATCRVCGHKIAVNSDSIGFYYDEEQNSWTGKLYQVHADAFECITR